ncbi:MAG TPA: UbiA family prenyltransferase [Frankiaceae bacterium]|nr:UbiA family prenyltransferase [Frankiaceae bacterium]
MRRRTGPAGLIALLRSSHPEPVIAVTAVASALAASAGRSAPGVVATGTAVLAGQLSVGWCNDAVDADRDRRSGRRDKPIARGEIGAATVRLAAVVALVACVPLSLLSGWRAAVAHLVAVLLAWGYDLGLKSTVVSVLPYAVAFGLLPAFVTLGLPGAPAPPWWATCAGALLGAGAHFANVLPDLDDDVATGVRGLPHRLGPSVSAAAAAGFLVLASAALVLGPGRGGTPGEPASAPVVAAAGLLVGGIVLAGFLLGRRPGSRAVFRAALVVAVLDVLLLLARGSALG